MFGTRVWLVTLSVLVALSWGCDTSKNAAMQRVADGLHYADQNDYQHALTSFEEAIGLNPEVAESHYYIGLIRLQHYHDPNQAVNSLERAIELEPQNPELRPEMFYQYGVALEELDRPLQAMSQYQEAVALDGDHAEAFYRMGRIQEGEGEIRSAIDYYTRSIHAQPRFPFAYNALGNIYLRYGRPQEAIQVFENGIENNPDEMQNRSDIARVYMSLGTVEDLTAAISYLNQVAEAPSASFAVQFNLGVAYRERFVRNGSEADHASAVEWMERAQQRCNPHEEAARCDSIAAALRELAPSVVAPE